jgi:hypothetical protein
MLTTVKNAPQRPSSQSQQHTVCTDPSVQRQNRFPGTDKRFFYLL